MAAPRKTSGNGKPSRTINVNELRAARAEAAKEPVLVLIGDEEVELPAELPAEAAFLIAEGDIGRGLTVLMGDKAQLYWAQEPRPSINEVNAFLNEIVVTYGFEGLGELSASSDS